MTILTASTPQRLLAGLVLGWCCLLGCIQSSFLAAQEWVVVEGTRAPLIREGLGSRLGKGAIPIKTLGGPVAWTDYVIDGEWRIQKNECVGHYRLLDNRERRVAFGSLDDCFQELNRRRASGEIPPMPSHVVITLHGLAGTRGIMVGLDKHLEANGFAVINFGYASTKGNIQELTVGLDSVVRNLRGVHEVSFVGHSMGNMLVRHLLFRFQTMGYPPGVACRRMVMISPPNHGADIAETIGQSRIVQAVLGSQVVDQFAPNMGWQQLERQLATPNFEFGIVAGGRGTENGFLPRVPGDDDGLISIQTHMLNGSSDFIQVGGLHQLMPSYRRTKDATLKFLQCGHF